VTKNKPAADVLARKQHHQPNPKHDTHPILTLGSLRIILHGLLKQSQPFQAAFGCLSHS
jgi:hypothetical protein